MECTQIGSHDVGAANRFWRVEMLLKLVLIGFMYGWGYYKNDFRSVMFLSFKNLV